MYTTVHTKNALWVTRLAMMLLVLTCLWMPAALAQEKAPQGVELAKEIALKDAGLTGDEVIWTGLETYRRRNVPIIEIDFLDAAKKYSYEINEETGEILSSYTRERHERDWLARYIQKQGVESLALIGMEEALCIAYERAGVTADQVESFDIDLDEDDGRILYEIEFYQGRMEYECEIDALNGDILQWEQDRD